MKARIILVLSMVLTIFLAGCGKKEIQNAEDWPLDSFTFKNQEEQDFGKKDLKGKIWVADFIFTSCQDVCLPMTANMKKLQQKAKEEGIEDIHFVSFTVDPEVDTPQVLKEYGQRFEANFENWSFLTGYSQSEIESFVLKNFKAIVKKPEEGNQVIHGTSLYLIDQNGTIKKTYSGLNDIPMEEIIDDIKILN